MPALPGTDGPAIPERVRSGGLDGVTRYDAISRGIGSKIREVRLGRISRDEALADTRRYNLTVLDPPWADARQVREFEALEQIDFLNHGPDAPASGECASEDELARRLAIEHGTHWKHSAAMGGWLHWTGTYWAQEMRKGVTELARDYCRSAARANPQYRARLLSNRTIQAVAKLACSDPRVAADGMVWDADPMRLNTPAGIIDLESGEWSPCDPAAAMTRITEAGPGGACPRWLEFVDTFTLGDPALASYLARVTGYCLTGATTEQVFFFLHGAGANGKSVFLEALSDALDSYATTAPLETFMASRSDRHPTELVGFVELAWSP